jgi:glycerol-3-phosphate dehydrogenase (NAD(P)+)
MAIIGVIGAGSWGIALSVLLHANGHEVCIWSILEDEIKMLNETHEHKDKLPGVKLSEEIKFLIDLNETIQGKDVLILAVPSPYVRSTAKLMNKFVKKGQILQKGLKNLRLVLCLKLLNRKCLKLKLLFYQDLLMQKR